MSNMHNVPKAVIFDMDGTIVDTEPVVSKVYDRIIREYGKEPKLHKNGLIQTPGVEGLKMYEELILAYDLPNDPIMLRTKRRTYYVEALKNNVRLLPGFFELVGLLKSHRIKIGLASNSIQQHVDIVLGEIDATRQFDTTVGWDEVMLPKPAPDIYTRNTKNLNVSIADCVAVEDTSVGITAAKSAGMKAIAVPNHYTKDQDFSKADILVNSLAEITIPLLQKLYD